MEVIHEIARLWVSAHILMIFWLINHFNPEVTSAKGERNGET